MKPHTKIYGPKNTKRRNKNAPKVETHMPNGKKKKGKRDIRKNHEMNPDPTEKSPWCYKAVRQCRDKATV